MTVNYDDRRDSQRVPFTFQVRERALGGSFEPREGNLSIGGVYFTGHHPPSGAVVELRFIVPGHDHEVSAVGEVIRVSRDDEKFGAHIRFTDIPLDCELALARFFQSGPGPAGTP
jgi:PilZ domain-containing protein